MAARSEPRKTREEQRVFLTIVNVHDKQPRFSFEQDNWAEVWHRFGCWRWLFGITDGFVSRLGGFLELGGGEGPELFYTPYEVGGDYWAGWREGSCWEGIKGG